MPTVLTVNLAAQQQAAMHRTQLLLARCGGCRPPCAPMAYEQARWHALQQADFLAWLDAGGFMQAYPGHPERPGVASAVASVPARAPKQCTIENSGMTPLLSAP